MEKTFKVEGMHCPHCSARVEKALIPLGLEVTVDLEKGEVKVSGDYQDADIKEAIEELGFVVK